MNSNSVLLVNEDELQIKELTIDQAYEITGGHGLYQFIVAASIAIMIFSNMFYLFSVPLFIITPVVLDKNGIPFKDIETACNSTYYYEDKHFNYITEFDLLCSPMRASIISSMFQVGITISGLILGSISDRIGRIPIFLLEECGIVFSLAAIMYFNNYTACLFFTAMCGFFSFAPLCYPFAYEWNHSKYIKFYASYIGIMYATGELIVAGLIWVGFKWREACICAIIVCFIYMLFPWFIEDGPKYYYSKGKVNYAIKVFKQVAKVNKKPITHRFTLIDVSANLAKAGTFKEQLRLICQKWVLFRLGICCCIFFACGFIYFGFSLNVQKFIGNPYMNAICNGIAEIIGVITIYILSSYKGIHFSLFCAFIITFLVLVVQYFNSNHQVIANCAMYIGKFSISGGFTLAYTLGGELFPTAVSTTCIAVLSLSERIGAIISPIVGNNPTYFMIMAAVCSFIAGVAVLVLYCKVKK